MTAQEVKEAFEELKAQGETEEDIAGALYMMFQEDKISLDELKELVQFLGYELSPEFLAMSPEDQKTKGWAEEESGENENKPAEGVSKEDVEAAKEYKPEDKDDSDKDDSDKDDNDEESRAKKLFGFDK